MKLHQTMKRKPMNNIQTVEYLNFTIYNAQNLPIDFLTMIMITIRIMIVTDWVGNVVELLLCA